MKRTWVELYALAVCFFAVSCFVVVLGMAAWSTIEITAPEFTMDNFHWEKHQSDEAYRDALVDRYRCREKDDPYVPPEGAALTREREESYARQIRGERRSGFQGLVYDLIILFIDALIFFVHWRIAARVRREAV